MEQPNPLSKPSPPEAEPVVAPAKAAVVSRPATVMFAEAAKVLAAGARSFGLVAPSYRTPPRLVGLDRTVRRHAKGGSVAVRVRGRPWPAVVADMIDGVVAINRLDSARANRVRADLWEVLMAKTAGTAREPADTGSARVAGPPRAA